MARLHIALALGLVLLAASVQARPEYKPPSRRYKYYSLYFYWPRGTYGNQAKSYMDYYCRYYYKMAPQWFGYRGDNWYYGFSSGTNARWNAYSSQYPGSFGGWVTFGSYDAMYNFAWHPKYGLYSGWYKNNGERDFDDQFRSLPDDNPGGNDAGGGFRFADTAPDLQVEF